ncbi:hypothetical protein Bbelb_385250 [Branchiostoma belcheri]|nr:hypothetical protein Bbelb_385250 [Branchiostoma belcheri]
MLKLLIAVCAALPLVSGWTTPAVDWRPCGDFPWDTDDVTVSCDYTYSYSSYNEHLHGRCTVTCPVEADVLVGPPYSEYSPISDGAYYCNVGNSTWMGSEPVCLGRYNSSVVITDDTNMVRLVGGEFYGCVEMYDDVTQPWGPVTGWWVYDVAAMSWADLACRDLGFREGLATAAYPLSNGGVSSSWARPLQDHYRPSYPSTVPKFIVSDSLPQWENATLWDAIDRVDRGSGYISYPMCLACAKERTQDGQQDPKPCGDFPWDTDDVTVSCNYTYSYSSYDMDLQGRCTVTCPPEADMLVGPPYVEWSVRDGAYYCNVGNSTWMGTEPVCLGRYDSSTVITDDTNRVRLVGGESYGCVELYDDVTGQWGPIRGWNTDWGSHQVARMAWADLACRDLGFREGLATSAYLLANGVVDVQYAYTLQWRYIISRQAYPSLQYSVPKFMVSHTLPQWEGATLRDAIDRVERGDYCVSNSWSCSRDYMCLACAGERTQDGPQDPKPCGDFPWDTADVTVSCNYTYSDEKRPWGQDPLVLQGRCTVTCPPEADMLVGPPYSERSNGGYGVEDGAYYCNVGNSTWMGSEPVCLGHYDSSTVITNYTNRIRLVGGEFYGCVELYDGVTGQWGPVRGLYVEFWGSHYDARMSWVALACRDLGFRQGLSTLAYKLANGVLSSYSSWSYLQRHYHPSHPSTVPKFMLSQTLPQWEGATLHDAIDRVVRGPCPDNDWLCRDYTMCLACAGERTQDGQQDLAAQVTCTSDHLEVSFPRPPDNSVQAADVQLAAPPCRAEQNSTHIYIRTHFEKCGTSTETTPSELIYRNTLTVGADPSSGGITWYRVPKILLECRLPRNKTLSLHFRPHLNSVFRSHAQGWGEFEISMELFRTDGFRQPVTEYPVYVDLRQVSSEYPVFVELRHMIHVQIQVNSNGTDLQVFPHTCVATPSDDPSDTTRNDVIVDGCAKLPTLQFYPSPGPDRGRFGFQAFAYTSGVPTGPIVLGDDQTEFQARVPSPNSGRQDLVTASSILGACAVLAAAMFVLGVLYKARREGRQSGYRSQKTRLDVPQTLQLEKSRFSVAIYYVCPQITAGGSRAKETSIYYTWMAPSRCHGNVSSLSGCPRTSHPSQNPPITRYHGNVFPTLSRVASVQIPVLIAEVVGSCGVATECATRNQEVPGQPVRPETPRYLRPDSCSFKIRLTSSVSAFKELLLLLKEREREGQADSFHLTQINVLNSHPGISEPRFATETWTCSLTAGPTARYKYNSLFAARKAGRGVTLSRKEPSTLLEKTRGDPVLVAWIPDSCQGKLPVQPN